MRRTSFYFAPFILMLLTFSFCKTATYTTDNLPTRQLYFGSGGGFTGAVSEYLVLDNGQVFKHPSANVYNPMKKTSAKKAAAFYKQYDEDKIGDIRFNRPGNMYYFIRMVDGDSEHYISWGDNNKNNHPKVKELHLNLMKIVKAK